MAENTSTFTGAAADGTALTAVYLTQPRRQCGDRSGVCRQRPAAHRPLGSPAGQGPTTLLAAS